MLRIFLAVLATGLSVTGPMCAQELSSPKAAIDLIQDYFDGLRAWELGERKIAIGIWVQAAQLGDRRAMRRVAQLFEEGIELPKDEALSFFWFAISERLGEQASKLDAERLLTKIPSASREAIKHQADEWKPPLPKDGVANKIDQPKRRRNVNDLVNALHRRDLDDFRSILQNEVSGAGNTDGGTPLLIFTVASGQLEFVRALFEGPPEKQAKAEVTAGNGMNALHAAAALGNLPMVEYLLDRGIQSGFRR